MRYFHLVVVSSIPERNKRLLYKIDGQKLHERCEFKEYRTRTKNKTGKRNTWRFFLGGGAHKLKRERVHV